MIRNLDNGGGGFGFSKGIGMNGPNNGVFVNGVSNISESQRNPAVDDDDEEWYPPSPPIYDVADKLIEINRLLYDDPTSLVRNGPGKLRWKPDSYLVQVIQNYWFGYEINDK